MATTYAYEITSFPQQLVALDRLASEIAASSIVTAMESLTMTGTTTKATFKAALSVGDKATLDTLVGVHSGQPLPSTATQVSLDTPKTSDGKIIFQPSMFPGGVYLYITGAGDDGQRGNGQSFAFASDEVGDSSIEFGFKDWVYLASGGLLWQNAEFGDWVSFSFHAPASVVTPNGTNTGNCNLVDPGVGNPVLIVPANGNGAYNINLADANPIPAYGPNDAPVGYWDWSEPNTGRGVITPSASPGKAGWYLFAVDMPLVRFANRVHLLGSGAMDMNPPPIKSKKMLPHWKGRVTLHNSGHTGLKVAWYLATARAVTT